MKFRAKVSVNSLSLMAISGLLVALCVYLSVHYVSWKLIVLTVLITVPFLLFIVPMILLVKFVFAGELLVLSAGPFLKRTLALSKIYGYEMTNIAARVDFGFSEQKVAIFYKDREDKDAVVTVSPKYIRDFTDALKKYTGLDITPPEPGYQEVLDQYKKNASETQRKAARKRLFSIIKEGYKDEKLEAVSAEKLREKIEAARSVKQAEAVAEAEKSKDTKSD